MIGPTMHCDHMLQDDWPHNALHLCDLPIWQQLTSGDSDLLTASEILKEQVSLASSYIHSVSLCSVSKQPGARGIYHIRSIKHTC